ncbi:MAG: hypothetical protein QOJ38_1421 [Solirubrobacterales bacterium]|jgi:uncharacterized YceG family protein|nr:hypothetical protein [Solirubrobacterales bacterium]
MTEQNLDPPSDEFGRTDPESIERERRRREREERRREQQQRQQQREQPQPQQPPPPPQAPVPEQPAASRPQPAPPKPRREISNPLSGRGEALAGGLAAARERLRRPRRERAERAEAVVPAVPAEPTGPKHPRGPRIVLALVVLLIAAFLVLLFQPFHGRGSGSVVVMIPKGANASRVADILDEQGVIANGSLFQLRLRLSGKSSDIQAGRYTLARDMSYGAAIDALAGKHVVAVPTKTITVVIPEGDSRQQIAQIVNRDGLRGNYMRASESSKLLNPKRYGGKRAKSLEGFLFPATYTLKPRATAADLVAQQIGAFKQSIAKVNMRYARKKNLTTYDVLTIASMVEREVQVPKERPLVAAVIYNRLHQHIPLGIDATVRYAVGNFDTPLKQSELASSSPYNTRKFAGLPPGPIGNPGIASIRAAAKPARVRYLFYVVKPGSCGEHSFANNIGEFNRLVARYNRARQAAGGKSPTRCG